MKRIICLLALLLSATAAFAQFTNTPNIGLKVPIRGSNNWDIPLYYDWTMIDNMLGGQVALPNGLKVTGPVSMPGFTFTSSQIVAGLGYQPLNPANNLSDVNNAATALANLGGIGANSYQGTWSSSTSYSSGALVNYSGVTYISLQAGNVNNIPSSSPSYWGAFGSGGLPSGTGVVGVNSGAGALLTSSQIASYLSATPSPVTVSTLTATASVTTPQLNGISFSDPTGYNLNIGGSMPSGVTGTYNTGVGLAALASVTTGASNTAIGHQSGMWITTGLFNTLVGDQSAGATTGTYNEGFGFQTLYTNTSGSYNAAFGTQALYALTTANDNAAFGTQALYADTTGADNVGIGTNALYQITTGSENVAVGFDAGTNTSPLLTTISDSTFLGWGATSSTDGLTNMLVLGWGAVGTASNQVTLGNSSITSTILQGAVTGGTSITAPSLTATTSVTTPTLNASTSVTTPLLNATSVYVTNLTSQACIGTDASGKLETGTCTGTVTTTGTPASGDIAAFSGSTSITAATSAQMAAAMSATPSPISVSSISGMTTPLSPGQGGTGTTNFTPTYVQSRGQNLVTNGSGSMLLNYNFSGFTFDPEDTYSAVGSFAAGPTTGDIFLDTDELIPVDPTQTYTMSFWAKSGNLDGTDYSATNSNYIGIALFDIDGNNITPLATDHVAGAADTTLAVALNPGDTTATLTNAAGWNATTNNNAMTWWPFVNKAGYSWPAYTFSQNYQFNVFSSVTGNVLNLTVPWAGPALPVGTPVRNSFNSNSYKYTVTGVGPETIPNAWTFFSGNISGWGDTTWAPNTFSVGTAYVKPEFVLNAPTATINNIRISGLSFALIHTTVPTLTATTSVTTPSFTDSGLGVSLPVCTNGSSTLTTTSCNIATLGGTQTFSAPITFTGGVNFTAGSIGINAVGFYINGTTLVAISGGASLQMAPTNTATSSNNYAGTITDKQAAYWSGTIADRGGFTDLATPATGNNPLITLTHSFNANDCLGCSGGTATGQETWNYPVTFASTVNGLTMPSASGNANFTQTIASGVAYLPTTAIAASACGGVVTVAATGVLATDNIAADFNSSPIAIIGYEPGAMLTIIKYPTAGNVNFQQCNNTAASITPAAVTLDWRVTR